MKWEIYLVFGGRREDKPSARGSSRQSLERALQRWSEATAEYVVVVRERGGVPWVGSGNEAFDFWIG